MMPAENSKAVRSSGGACWLISEAGPRGGLSAFNLVATRNWAHE
jgi:hypothetical protein